MRKPSGGWASVVALCLQYIEGVNRLRGREVCKWLIWMAEIIVGCGQEDAVWGFVRELCRCERRQFCPFGFAQGFACGCTPARSTALRAEWKRFARLGYLGLRPGLVYCAPLALVVAGLQVAWHRASFVSANWVEWGTEGDQAVSFARWCGSPQAIGRHPL